MEMLGKSHGRGWGIDKNCIEVQADILNVGYLNALAERYCIDIPKWRDDGRVGREDGEGESIEGEDQESGNSSEGDSDDGKEIEENITITPAPVLSSQSPPHSMNLSSVLSNLPPMIVEKIKPWTQGLANRGLIKIHKPMATRVGIAAMLSGLSPSSGLIICLGRGQDYRDVQRILMDSLVSCTSTPFALLIARREISEKSINKSVSFMTGEENRQMIRIVILGGRIKKCMMKQLSSIAKEQNVLLFRGAGFYFKTTLKKTTTLLGRELDSAKRVMIVATQTGSWNEADDPTRSGDIDMDRLWRICNIDGRTFYSILDYRYDQMSEEKKREYRKKVSVRIDWRDRGECKDRESGDSEYEENGSNYSSEQMGEGEEDGDTGEYSVECISSHVPYTHI